jgi:hypothetical protein
MFWTAGLFGGRAPYETETLPEFFNRASCGLSDALSDDVSVSSGFSFAMVSSPHLFIITLAMVQQARSSPIIFRSIISRAS